MQELEGQIFGSWTVLYKDMENKTHDIKWICKCQCGTIKSVLGKYLLNGKSKSCGCVKKAKTTQRIDLVGRTINQLTILETLYGYNGFNHVTYKCKCSCGKIIYVKGSSIYKQKSCGCSRRCKDITGEQYGKLTVTKMIYDKYDETYCECVCECGRIIEVKRASLVSGNTKSCGCIHSPTMIGKRFDKLLVINEFYENKHKYCICQCDCGNITTILGHSLTNGNSTSCGCKRQEKVSIREKIIREYFEDHKIQYICDKTFPSLKGIGGKSLRFDFYLPTYNTLIEYDGEQHFVPKDFFGGEESFLVQKQNDEIKNRFCIEKNIPLTRIPYTLTENEIYDILNKIIISIPLTTTA